MKKPDYAADFFSINRLPDLLAQRGAVLIRRLLPPALCAEWLPRFERVYQETDQLFQSGAMSLKDRQQFYEIGHPVIQDKSDLALWAWWQVLLQQHGLAHLLRSYFGPKAAVFAGHSLPRRQLPETPEVGLPFHQDYEYLGGFAKGLNLWIPLTPAGEDSPGLELWLDLPQAPILHFGQPSHERLETLHRLPEGRWQPVMAPGDVLVFTPFTLHRSLIMPGMTCARYSYEFRLCSLADAEESPHPMIERDL